MSNGYQPKTRPERIEPPKCEPTYQPNELPSDIRRDMLFLNFLWKKIGSEKMGEYVEEFRSVHKETT